MQFCTSYTSCTSPICTPCTSHTSPICTSCTSQQVPPNKYLIYLLYLFHAYLLYLHLMYLRLHPLRRRNHLRSMTIRVRYVPMFSHAPCCYLGDHFLLFRNSQTGRFAASSTTSRAQDYSWQRNYR